MLRYLSCSGFKSFDGFEIKFNPGLNVLVGPNGSGKTNIILFLQFLSSLRNSPLIEAFGQIGGAGTAFRRNGLELTNEINFKITGEGSYGDYVSGKSFHGYYEYEASIKLLMRDGTLIFDRQRYIAYIGDSAAQLFSARVNSDPAIDVETSLDEGKGIQNVEIYKLDKSQAGRFSRKSVDDSWAQLLDICQNLSKNYSLLAFIGQATKSGDFPNQDLWGANSYNILPSKVREPEDISSYPRIHPDGSGLAATLYALQNDAPDRDQSYAYVIPYRPSFKNAHLLRNQIISSGRLINDNIEDIRVHPDPFENKLRISVDVKSGVNKVILPFSYVSDGTAKWYALVAAVITNRRLFAIEEPENFLHPMMQAEIIKLVRSQYSVSHSDEDLPSDKFAIITTHSETILDHCKPTELILVNNIDGNTKSNRCSNAEDIDSEVRRTGFGLGYYYISGAIE